MASGVVAGVIALVGAATSAYASYESGRQQQKVSKANARMLENEAAQAKYAAKVKAGQYRKEAARRMAQMRAGYAASGVATTEGTPLLVLMESASEAATDEERIRQGGEMDAWGLMARAGIQRTAGESAASRGALGAGSSLLGGAARVYEAVKR